MREKRKRIFGAKRKTPKKTLSRRFCRDPLIHGGLPLPRCGYSFLRASLSPLFLFSLCHSFFSYYTYDSSNVISDVVICPFPFPDFFFWLGPPQVIENSQPYAVPKQENSPDPFFLRCFFTDFFL